MRARLEVEGDLSLLEPLLPGVQSILGQRLDGIGRAGEDVHSIVNHAVRSNPKDPGELQAAGEELAYSVLRASRGNAGGRRRRTHDGRLLERLRG